jgi:hypothetical protein
VVEVDGADVVYVAGVTQSPKMVGRVVRVGEDGLRAGGLVRGDGIRPSCGSFQP